MKFGVQHGNGEISVTTPRLLTEQWDISDNLVKKIPPTNPSISGVQ